MTLTSWAETERPPDRYPGMQAQKKKGGWGLPALGSLRKMPRLAVFLTTSPGSLQHVDVVEDKLDAENLR